MSGLVCIVQVLFPFASPAQRSSVCLLAEHHLIHIVIQTMHKLHIHIIYTSTMMTEPNIMYG